MGSHFRINARPVAFTFTIPLVSVTKIGSSWPRRIWRKREALAKLVHFLNSLRQLVEWLFLRVRTASDARGRISHAA